MRTNLVIRRIYESDLKEPYSNCKEFIQLEPENGSSPIFDYNQAECFQLCQYRALFNACGELHAFHENSFNYFERISEFLSIHNSVRDSCNRTIVKEVIQRFKQEGIINYICFSLTEVLKF